MRIYIFVFKNDIFFQTHMTVSQRTLSAMLNRLVNLTQDRAHSEVLCKRCFNLVEQVDCLEIELADFKVELIQQFEATLSHRQPLTKCEIQRPTVSDHLLRFYFSISIFRQKYFASHYKFTKLFILWLHIYFIKKYGKIFFLIKHENFGTF